MLWHAMPPELNTARLMAGAGPAPMLAAAAGWESLAAALDAQAVELTARLNSLGEAWTGGGSDKAISSALPMVTWLQTASAQAKTRGMQAAAQAAAYTQAMATTPSLPEIAANHITTAVLCATNFLGINTIPIALNEIDYFVRMWTQAAVAMDIYQAETLVNTMFDKIEPMAAILDPGMSQSMASSPLIGMPAQLGALTPETVQATAGQVAELSGPMQQLAQPAQQMTSMFSQLGSNSGGTGTGLGDDEAQLGLLGASPLSNHPLAGGSGASVGAGLLRGEAIPGAGGTLARTPLMTGLIDKPAGPAVLPAAAAGESATGGTAPVGTGALGQGAPGGGTRAALAVPAAAADEHDEPEEDLWDDDDDW
ncbi:MULTISPECIES: PPE family protein [Mycobacterium]|uniref:PPE family immunomodulator PPE68 n=1 Tax=Mycobacterium kiyosense TaxID=2871094 RepID=A0A9P3UZD2_9MYCO|nr:MULTISPECIES: PPE family protein [Mycobacterium]BDB45773.1 PPE family immunomodulator PPE68 [Mycobacterium kiyosense]BDE11383.1 PPE family immunomodulator PPE68 [Mycobacterium sp. 20KCMC460]GLB86246.1 PPE family immunomodulator PPE68 [Mycobacterium kiyosense]GLB92814.1 PPE family immunomodulator PPE68 [Mycobacterium kiyosense]GLB98838.1 PPE family immunomodulator PPE68 [Mycobacterium kiyosense]